MTIPSDNFSDAASQTPQLAITVVIPTWARAAWLDRCLAGLCRQSRRPEGVIVVGRAEDTAAQDVVARCGVEAAFPVQWVAVVRPGHIAPIRVGLEAARSEIVAFLDDDTEPEAAWLEALVKCFADPQVACVGGRVVTLGSAVRLTRAPGRVRWYGQHVANLGALDAPHPIEVDAAMEGNWAWRTTVLQNLTFDPELDVDDASMYGLDLCLQARERGLRVVYAPRARVMHHAAPRDPSLSRRDGPRRTATYSRNYTYIALKHLRGLRRAAFCGWWFLIGERGSYGLAKAMVDLMRSRDRVSSLVVASFQGKWEGVRVWWTRGR